MDLGINGRRALVTGGGRGIGRAIAVALAAEGVCVAVTSRTESDLASLRSELSATPGSHLFVPFDMQEDGAPAALADYLCERFWPLDIVVHNLGGTLDISDPFCPLDDWRRVWRFNLEVAIELNLSFLPPMQTQAWGRIVHIASIAGLENQGPVTYCTAKAALIAYVRSMGRVVAKDGVVMNSVLPGAVFTENGYWDDASKNRPDHVAKYLQERMAIQRFGRLEEVSRLAAFMCSEHASFCTGSAVLVDGGQGRCFPIG